jgi:5'-nucleotidase (lipoprotein e(P4) family)
MRSNLALTLLAAACLAGCASIAPVATAPAPAPATGVAAQTPPADDSLNATAWFQTSVERDLVFREVYRAAGEHLQTALADKRWDALPKEDRNGDVRKLPPAIIVDVDETVLDNSPSQVRQIRGRRGFDEAAWGAWVEERKAKPLPGAAEFLNAAARRGVTVFYISNRDASRADATVDNLRKAGFPLTDGSQFLGLGTVVEGCEQEGSEKSCRRQLVGRTHRVLMQFGDQVGDFVQIIANTPDGRRAAVAPYLDWVGQRWWVLPNPVYGSWEPALFNNDRRQPEGARRAQKEAALDDAR